jgi:hypothetical protein
MQSRGRWVFGRRLCRSSLSHTDALVVSLTIANFQLRRILVDTGSLADILFKSAFDHMSILRERVVPVVCHLLGFAGEKVSPLGSEAEGYHDKVPDSGQGLGV